MSDPVLLSIDCQTFRVRRYVGKVLTWNHRFNRLPDEKETQEMRTLEGIVIPKTPEAA